MEKKAIKKTNQYITWHFYSKSLILHHNQKYYNIWCQNVL